MHQFANLSSYAEQLLVHEHAVVNIREDMPLDKAALIGCGVTTGVGAVINTAKVPPGSTVAVIGCEVSGSAPSRGLPSLGPDASSPLTPGRASWNSRKFVAPQTS